MPALAGRTEQRCTKCHRLLPVKCFAVETRSNIPGISYLFLYPSCLDCKREKDRGREYRVRPYVPQSGRGRTPRQIVRARFKSALRQGKLSRKSCEVCGDIKAEAHHKDYSKPFEVVWLCMKHHRELHRKEPIANALRTA